MVYGVPSYLLYLLITGILLVNTKCNVFAMYVAIATNSSQPGQFHVETYKHVLGL